MMPLLPSSTKETNNELDTHYTRLPFLTMRALSRDVVLVAVVMGRIQRYCCSGLAGVIDRETLLVFAKKCSKNIMMALLS